ncbi:IS3 family transposase [Tahibacter amnicola]|uniref:IS3 family transposase n=1 Tax=Tahibacter amnicola TaxID=2976241 RepID=A0ABY6BAP6_9GAMM|nr:IS3 family transposase [Tahibacter amnicola]UXI66930.1 IS3 family transposase [Tahibacter amnicola]
MARYGKAFRDRAVARLLPPESADVNVVSREIGISADTLERWRAEALASGQKNGGWTAGARFAALLTTAAMSEEEKNAWCRSQGLFPSELAQWRAAATGALERPDAAQQVPSERRQVKELERELRRKEKALAETAALLVLSKKPRGDLPQGRGRMIAMEDRRWMVEAIDEAHCSGARLSVACSLAGIDIRTLQRWRRDGGLETGDRRPMAVRPVPAHALTSQERAAILEIANEPRFAALPPAQIVPRLADEGRYVASESSFHRVLRHNQQTTHRGRAKAPERRKEPTTHIATAPGQVWCWDVTWLPSRVKGQWFYLYLILDIYSRHIVGHEVQQVESGEHAAHLAKRVALAEGVHTALNKPVLHGDNGASLKATTVLAMLQWLGIAPSYSRPRVSNDNAYAESLFRTAKYRSGYPPEGFGDIQAARRWAADFVHWYNGEHRHSGIQFVTPAQRHRGEDHAILRARHHLYESARAQNPRRWSRGVRDWSPTGAVTLNPDKLVN